MIYSDRQTIAAAATPVALTATKTICGWLTVHANALNAGYIYVGDSTTTNNGGGTKAYIGHPIAPGSWVSFRELGGPAYMDLNLIYAAADNDGDKLTFNYGRR